MSVAHAVQALAALGQFIEDGSLQFADDERLIASALMLALALEHKVPDCLYLALAERDGATLVTADRVLANLAKRHGVPALLLPSASA